MLTVKHFLLTTSFRLRDYERHSTGNSIKLYRLVKDTCSRPWFQTSSSWSCNQKRNVHYLELEGQSVSDCQAHHFQKATVGNELYSDQRKKSNLQPLQTHVKFVNHFTDDDRASTKTLPAGQSKQICNDRSWSNLHCDHTNQSLKWVSMRKWGSGCLRLVNITGNTHHACPAVDPLCVVDEPEGCWRHLRDPGWLLHALWHRIMHVVLLWLKECSPGMSINCFLLVHLYSGTYWTGLNLLLKATL